jgi:hypothetical protein
VEGRGWKQRETSLCFKAFLNHDNLWKGKGLGSIWSPVWWLGRSLDSPWATVMSHSVHICKWKGALVAVKILELKEVQRERKKVLNLECNMLSPMYLRVSVFPSLSLPHYCMKPARQKWDRFIGNIYLPGMKQFEGLVGERWDYSLSLAYQNALVGLGTQSEGPA